MSASPAQRITEAAERTFLRSGFSQVLMDDLARELGMSKKTLYAHFPGKEALVRAVLRHRIAGVDAAMREIVESGAAFREKMGRLTHLLQTRMGEVSPVFIADIRRHAPECFRIIEEFRARAIPLYFGRLLEDGVRAGHLRGDVDRELLVRVLVISIQGIIRPDVIGELRLHPRAAVEGILDIVFQGILTPRGRRSRKLLRA